MVGVVVATSLFALSWFYGKIPLEALAEPADTTYIPRPDWYFLGLFQLLKEFEDRPVIGAFWITV